MHINFSAMRARYGRYGGGRFAGARSFGEDVFQVETGPSATGALNQIAGGGGSIDWLGGFSTITSGIASVLSNVLPFFNSSAAGAPPGTKTPTGPSGTPYFPQPQGGGFNPAALLKSPVVLVGLGVGAYLLLRKK